MALTSILDTSVCKQPPGLLEDTLGLIPLSPVVLLIYSLFSCAARQLGLVWSKALRLTEAAASLDSCTLLLSVVRVDRK